MKTFLQRWAILWLILWIIGGVAGVYWYTGHIGLSAESALSNSEILIKHEDFEIRLSKPITYQRDQIEASLSKEINEAIVSLSDHLIESPNLKLLITGLYTLAEEKSSPESNLGYLRAKEFKNLLVARGADPGNLFTSSKLTPKLDDRKKRFKGLELAVINENMKINTNPILDDGNSSIIKRTTLILPYFTSNFAHIDLLNDELSMYFERCIQNPELALYVSTYTSDSQEINSKMLNLEENLYSYILNQVNGLDIQVIKVDGEKKPLSDMDKQNIKIDIGIKRFQNNLEFLGS